MGQMRRAFNEKTPCTRLGSGTTPLRSFSALIAAIPSLILPTVALSAEGDQVRGDGMLFYLQWGTINDVTISRDNLFVVSDRPTADLRQSQNEPWPAPVRSR